MNFFAVMYFPPIWSAMFHPTELSAWIRSFQWCFIRNEMATGRSQDAFNQNFRHLPSGWMSSPSGVGCPGVVFNKERSLGRGPRSTASSAAILLLLRSGEPPPGHLDQLTDIYWCFKGCGKRYESAARWRDALVWRKGASFHVFSRLPLSLNLHIFTNLEALLLSSFQVSILSDGFAILPSFQQCLWQLWEHWCLHSPVIEFASMSCSFLCGLQAPFSIPSNDSLRFPLLIHSFFAHFFPGGCFCYFQIRAMTGSFVSFDAITQMLTRTTLPWWLI